MTNLKTLHEDRQSVYGPWKGNMVATSEQLTGLLRQFYSANPTYSELPSWWTPLTMVAVKLNRIASGTYHEDNFSDLRVYLDFVERMQGGQDSGISGRDGSDGADTRPKPEHKPATSLDGSRVERIYIAGPYSPGYSYTKEANVEIAAGFAAAVMLKGHDAHCPHTATHQVDQINPGTIDYERWMRLDMGLIEHWATAVFMYDPSPGAKREVALAEKLGKKVYRSLQEIPDITRS